MKNVRYSFLRGLVLVLASIGMLCSTAFAQAVDPCSPPDRVESVKMLAGQVNGVDVFLIRIENTNLPNCKALNQEVAIVLPTLSEVTAAATVADTEALFKSRVMAPMPAGTVTFDSPPTSYFEGLELYFFGFLDETYDNPQAISAAIGPQTNPWISTSFGGVEEALTGVAVASMALHYEASWGVSLSANAPAQSSLGAGPGEVLLKLLKGLYNSGKKGVRWLKRVGRRTSVKIITEEGTIIISTTEKIEKAAKLLKDSATVLRRIKRK